MIEIALAIKAATLAYGGLKTAIGTAKEIQGLTGDLTNWYNACSDIQRASQQVKNPTFFEKISRGSDNIDADSIQLLMHSKQQIEREKEIAFALNMKWGFGTYEELKDLRKSMRDERREVEHKRIETNRQIMNNLVIFGLCLGVVGIMGGGIYLIALVI